VRSERLLLGRGGRCWDEREQLVGLLPIAVEPALVFGAEDEDVDLGLSEGLRDIFRRTRVERAALKLREQAVRLRNRLPDREIGIGLALRDLAKALLDLLNLPVTLELNGD
jgi:hypothetical protein